MSSVAEYVQEIKDLTIIPAVLISILGLEDDNDLPFEKLEKMVQSDQVLVARLLKLANSPFFSRGNPVTNMKQIITRLGFKTVRSMVAMAMTDSLFNKGNYKKFRDEVWEHSIAKGVIAQIICEERKLKSELELALVAGLMQDLGKIVLNVIDREKYIQVLTDYITTDKSIYEIEKEKFEVDNCEMGIAAVELWKLPPKIGDTIRQRQIPIAEQSSLSQVLGWTECMVRTMGYGKNEVFHKDRLVQYFEHFQVPETDRDAFLSNYKVKLLENDLYKFCVTL